MKKLLVLLALCMVLAVVFVACEQPETPVDETTAGTTEAPTTQAPETETPTTQAPETEAPTTQAPETEPPTTETNPPATTEPPVVIDPVKVGMSFDQLFTGNGPATAGEENFFTPGQSGSWDGKAVIEDYNIDYVTVWGWVAFFAETPATFGYQIGDAEPVFDAAFFVEAEQPVLDAATSMGGKSAARMHISIPVLYVSGEDIVIKALAKDAVGTVETLVEFTLTKPVNPNAPVAFIPSADMASSIPGSPGITSATLSADGTFVTIDAIGSGDPYYQLPMLNGKGLVATHAVIKYRSNSTFTTSEMFVGSGAGPNGQGDNIRFELTCDGKWQLAIVDLSQATAVVDNVVNYLRWDCFAGASDATIDMAYIGLFNSAEAALAYDAQFAGIYVDTLNVPQDAWTVTGHKEGITPAEDPSHGPMVAAGGIATGALLHQGYISIGELDLAQFSKLIVYIGIDNSQVTLDHHAANPANRLILTSADQAMTMSPTDDVVIASVDYAPCGWAVTAFEIDLTGVDYNGPVYFTYDTLPGTFMLVGSIELVYDPNYVEPEEPETPAEDPYFAMAMNQAKNGETLYFTGVMAGEYLATSNNIADAAKVFVETHEEGLRQYVLVDGVKNYIEIHKNDAGKVRVWLTTEATQYYVMNEEANTYVVEFEGETYYLGTYNDFTTIGCSKIFYITGDNAANVGVSQYVVYWDAYPVAE